MLTHSFPRLSLGFVRPGSLRVFVSLEKASTYFTKAVARRLTRMVGSDSVNPIVLTI